MNWVSILVALLLIINVVFIPIGWIVKIVLILVIILLVGLVWWMLERTNKRIVM